MVSRTGARIEEDEDTSQQPHIPSAAAADTNSRKQFATIEHVFYFRA